VPPAALSLYETKINLPMQQAQQQPTNHGFQREKALLVSVRWRPPKMINFDSPNNQITTLKCSEFLIFLHAGMNDSQAR
jgi:hypothetical protein